MSESARAEFCDRCGVSIGLHPGNGTGTAEWECEVARQKADLIARFWNVGAGRE